MKSFIEALSANITARSRFTYGGKICVKCGEVKPFASFSKSKRSSDGTASRCKQCANAWYFENRDRESAKRKLNYEANKIEILKRCRSYYQNNRNKVLVSAKEYREANREAVSEIKKEWYCRSKDIVRARAKKWLSENEERYSEWLSEYKVRNREKILTYKLRYREKNRDKQSSYGKSWRLANRSRVNARAARHRSELICATPKWADLQAIDDLYFAAIGLRNTVGQPIEVDHIVPLRSKIVCGLHCEANLQLLLVGDNRRKSNTYWPDMP